MLKKTSFKNNAKNYFSRLGISISERGMTLPSPITYCTDSECMQSGPVGNYCQEGQKVMPLCNQGGILTKVLYWAVTRPAYQQMLTFKNASYTVFRA